MTNSLREETRFSSGHHNDDGSALSSILSQATNKKMITINDVKGKFETEAETSILMAVEENEKKVRMVKTGPDGELRPSFLTGIPSDKIHLFEDDGIADSSKKHGNGAVEEEHEKDSSDIDSTAGTMRAKDRFKAAANRAMMIQKLASVRDVDATLTANEANKYNETESAGNLIEKANAIFRASQEIENQNGNDIRDPESQLQSSKYFKVQPGTNAEANELHANGCSDDGEKTVNRERRCTTNGCYRRRCGPCYKFTNFVWLRRRDGLRKLSALSIALVILLGIAAILFYVFGNPVNDDGVAFSWVFILLARNCITFTLAIFTEAFLVDYLFLETKLAVKYIGKFLTLMTVQAKGWPLRILFFAMWNYILIIGDSKWKQYWLYWQHYVTMFTPLNPAPKNTTQFLHLTMTACIIVGVSTMFKRAFFAFYLGKKKYGEHDTISILFVYSNYF